MECPYLASFPTDVRETSLLMDQASVSFQTMEALNWAEFPYKPDVQFRMAYTDQEFLLHFRVREQSVRACCSQDNDAVWNDSCVEFFMAPAEDGLYYNLECNCIGTLLLGCGTNRHERQRAGKEITSRIRRWSSLGSRPFDEELGETNWELMLGVPFEVFFKHHFHALAGGRIKGNFYKCGNGLSRPHYLSWQAISSEKPDFHRPECFGEITFGPTFFH